MSKVYPLIDGFVGYGDKGAELLLRSDEAVDSSHPLVKERPELFTDVVPEAVQLAEAKAAPRRRSGRA